MVDRTLKSNYYNYSIVCLFINRGEHLPDLFEVHAATVHLGDDVPLHWAVINCGEVSFFVFDDVDLPVHPSSLG